MNSSAPQIGFDRFIKLEWAAIALKVRAGTASIDELNEMLDNAGLGKEAKAKTRTKLNALWLNPRPDVADFASRGVEIFKKNKSLIAALTWGMAIATYPFFGKLVEYTGRLTSIQGCCSSIEIHRRMSETFGDREVTKRATQAAIQTQAEWGAIERVDEGNRLTRQKPINLPNEGGVAWLVEAALRYGGKPVTVTTIGSIAVIYPFVLSQSLAYVVSNSPALELRSEGSTDHIVGLRTSI